MRKKEGLTVKELFEFLKQIIDDGKGDYKMKIDVNEYYTNLKEIQIIDKGDECEDRTVNVC